MLRLITLLMMFVLAIANGPAVAAAICEHNDGRAHAAALQSSDDRVSGIAQAEESAAKAVAADGALADAAGTLLGGYLVPATAAVAPSELPAIAPRATLPKRLTGRSVPPLLEPPHA